MDSSSIPAWSFACGAILVLVVAFVVVAVRKGTTIDNPGTPLTPDQESQVLTVARGGNKIEAIKLHRTLTGAGLKESKDAVEALMAGTPVARPSPRGSMTPDQEAQVLAALRGGNKIEAIKLHRTFTGLGLAESKAAVEALEGGR